MLEYIGLHKKGLANNSNQNRDAKQSKSEKRLSETLKSMNLNFKENVDFEGVFQLDFVVESDSNKFQKQRTIAIEVNGQYHLNSNGVFHLRDKRQLLRRYQLSSDQSLQESVEGITQDDKILNLKTRRKYAYLLQRGFEVVSIDSKLLHHSDQEELSEEL